MISNWSAFNTILGSSIVFILPVGLWLYLNDMTTIPILILFLIIGVGMVRSMFKAMTIFSSYQMIKTGVERIDSILNEEPLKDTVTPEESNGYSVEFDDVSFAYGEREVLHKVSFETGDRTITALVGPSGAGKSTIAQLIPRLWDIQEGNIRIGGADIRNIPVEKLMDTIAFVFQDTFIFSDTVASNIKMGKDVPEQVMIDAAKAAQIHEVIMSLPDGYDTIIGEGGHNLSGGEKQRISIARAVLKDAPIIILDEATAFSDPDNESKIQGAIGELIRNKTAVIVAHRLSTIKDSDQIIVVDEGKIVGKGTHDELLKEQELYRRMWESHISAQEWTVVS